MNNITPKVSTLVVSLAGAGPVFAHAGLPDEGLTHQLLHLLESHTLLLGGVMMILVGGVLAWQKTRRHPTALRRSK